MRNLIAVRHGDYSKRNGRLITKGKKQMISLSIIIKELVSGGFYFASSKAPRAYEGAEILRNNLAVGKTIEILDELFDENEYLTAEKIDSIHEKIKENEDKADNIILVTHYSVVKDYAAYFMKKELGKNKKIPEVSKGNGVHINLENKICHILRHK